MFLIVVDFRGLNCKTLWSVFYTILKLCFNDENVLKNTAEINF
jgi:hypothetical protein